VSALVFGGAELAVGGMAAARVVEPFDVAEQGPFGFRPGAEGAPVDQLALQGGKEALGDGIVEARPGSARRGTYAGLLAAPAEGDRGVLPLSLWWITPASGRRWCSAIAKASVTSSVRM
jgi:hypothetical protein